MLMRHGNSHEDFVGQYKYKVLVDLSSLGSRKEQRLLNVTKYEQDGHRFTIEVIFW